MSKKEKFLKQITNPLLYWFSMLLKLPSLVFWGVKLKFLTKEKCTVKLKQSWTNQNPFDSVYFSALNGAAELSTGALVLLHIQNEAQYSMLVVESTSKFLKKAKGRLEFTCIEGNDIERKISELTKESPACTFVANSAATDESGAEVGTFTFTWSVKMK